MDRQVKKAQIRWWGLCLRVAFYGMAILIGIALLEPMMFSHHLHYYPDSDVKSDLHNAATAQEAYFVDHDTYTSNIDSLKGYGYNQTYNVTMGASATTTTFVITGTTTKRCKPDTGTWTFNSTTGNITGTRCR